ncbi:MAG: hypothetical protein KIT87_23835 [Anaerolineae bacterium]|nr:hypothetical protein [Anaerolineae bacterium]
MRAIGPRWTLANALGLGLGLAAIRAAIPGFRGDSFQPGDEAAFPLLTPQSVLLLIGTGLPVGLALSLLQWWAIRPWLDQAQRWIPLTLGGLVLGWLLGVAFGVPLGRLATWLLPVQAVWQQTLIRVTIALVIGSLLGAGLGLVQGFAWRGQPSLPWRWTRVSAVGGGLGFTVMLLCLALFDTLIAPDRTAAALVAAFLAGALAGAVGSLVTGRWLTSL